MRNCWTKVISAALAALMAVLPVGAAVFADETPDILVGYKMSVPTLSAGSSTNVNIPIENRTHVEILSMVVSLDDPSKYPFEIQSMSSSSGAFHLGAKETRLYSLP